MVTDEKPALIVKAPAGSIIWIDRLRYGATNSESTLAVRTLPAGAHTLRARLKGKREVTLNFTSTNAPHEVVVRFTTAASPAELRFQTAEELRETGKHREAIAEYRRAITLNKRGYAAARIGLARSLMATEEYEDAVQQARRAVTESGGRNAEAYTVLGNTRRTQGLYDQAIVNYQTALEQARNSSPEAHTGLALTYQDRNRPEDAIRHLQTAAAQSRDTEPIIYFLLGSALERELRNREALEAYEKFLTLSPESRQASAVRSIIRQLQRDVR
ncbi:MAG: tetratricopeptide repeat protein [Acidobacteria bacterium]|nr:tetratricopeptide repeat protein [Acidobacteriota bacterium]